MLCQVFWLQFFALLFHIGKWNDPIILLITTLCSFHHKWILNILNFKMMSNNQLTVLCLCISCFHLDVNKPSQWYFLPL